jgi:hypothetical protein
MDTATGGEVEMGRKSTAGTRPLNVEMNAALRERLDARVGAEQRSLRTVVERALTFYMDNVPVESAPSVPAPAQPKRGRPRKLKGEQVVPTGKAK